MDLKEEAIHYHADGRRGKIEVQATKPLLTQRDLSLAYTPGVAEPCRRIAADPHAVYDFTAKGNLVAVVSNGTAVLGLGNIGPLAGKPVMEGKANLFKKFADIDVFDIELDARTPDEIVAAVQAIAPTFGGINLEDIKAPDCFEVERRLRESLDIPVFHDDQHGTAIIANAALINACRITGRELAAIKVVFSGAGAAAIATANLAVLLGVRRENVYMCDSKGLITRERAATMNNPYKAAYAQDGPAMSLGEVIEGADVFMGLSVAGAVTKDMVRRMKPEPIIFAMANPDPEITYEDAREAAPDAIVATGRSDYPNQVNNVLGFPFIFRGALDCRARAITEEMKVAAVHALADLAREDVPDSVLSAYGLERLRFGRDYLIPKPFDPRVLLWVAPAVARAAEEAGVARRPIGDYDAYRQHLESMVERSKEVIRPLIGRAQAAEPRRLVFSDGAHSRVLRAAQILVDEKICRPVLIGHGDRIRAMAAELDVRLDGIEIVEAVAPDRHESYARELWKLRERKGMTLAAARRWMQDPVNLGLMMVRRGEADGLLGGIELPYHFTIRPALKIVGTRPETRVISSVFVMLLRGRRLYFGDCTINQHLDAESLAQVAINTAQVAETLGDEPRVAMLSYSDFGEIRGEASVDTVREAVGIVRRLRPNLVVDGEMQADTALNAEKARAFPFSEIAGDANVLVFPDLDSANIAYKLMREVGGAVALGPVIVGLNRPVGALAIGSTVADVVNMAAITVSQAIRADARPDRGLA